MQYEIFWGRDSPLWARDASFTRFLDHTQRRTTVGRTPIDEWSPRRGDLYLTTHNTHKRQTSMPSVGFEPTILAGEQPKTYALDRATTGTGNIYIYIYIYFLVLLGLVNKGLRTDSGPLPTVLWPLLKKACPKETVFLKGGRSYTAHITSPSVV